MPVKSHHVMVSRFSTRKLTYDDFVNFPDDGQRHELIDGVHYVTPTPITKHQRVVMRLSTSLHNYLSANPIGEVFGVPLDVVMSRSDVVEPDVQVILREQQEILTEKNVQGTPAIVAEVLSPGTRRRDLGIKRDLYDRAGVREYWVLDPIRDTVTIYLRAPTATLAAQPELNRAAGDALACVLLPDWSLSLEVLFK